MVEELGPDVDLTVVHWRRPDWCLDTVRAIQSSTGVSVRVRVVDNDHSNAQGLGSRLPSSVIYDPAPNNLGYAGGANRGLRSALECRPPAKYFAVASHDCLPSPATLSALVDALDRAPELGVVGPLLIQGRGALAGGDWRGWRACLRNDVPEGVARRDWLSGTLLMFRRPCLRATGGFDETFGSYVEDVDICLRAGATGWGAAVVPTAIVRHNGSVSSNVTKYVDVNSARLVARREGLLGLVPVLGRYVAWVPRGFVAALVPGRSFSRRRSSIAHALDHGAATLDVIRLLPHLPGPAAPRIDYLDAELRG